MLDSLRLFAKSWVGKILGVFLLIGLGGFGLSNLVTGLSAGSVAKVGGQEISIAQFQRAYQTQISTVSQQIGQNITPQQAVQFGLPSSVIQQLGDEAALTQMTQDFGLGVSEDRLSVLLRNDPSFSGTLGNFNRDTFRQTLAQNGLTENEYFRLQSDSAARQQIILSLFGDVSIPAAASNLINRYAGDRRTVDYFVVNDASILPEAEPTEAEIAAYHTEHQSEFRTVETRKVQLLTLSPTILATTKTITDEQIAAEYERTKASLVRPERRSILQVALPTAEVVAAFEAGQAAGQSFDQLVQAAALTPTDLGLRTQPEISDAALASTAFGLSQGAFAIIDGVGGKRAVAVSTIEAGGEQPLDAVRETIRNNLALAEARNEYTDTLDQVEELRAAFQPIGTIAERFGLIATEVDLAATGAELAAVPTVPAAEYPRVAQAVFAAEQGRLAPSVALSGSQTLWFDLESTAPARDQTLDEVRDQVVAALTLERSNQAIAAKVDEILAQLTSGTDFAQVAASNNQFPQLSQPFSRGGDGTTLINDTVASAAFAGPAGHFGAAVNGDGDNVIFRVVDVTPVDGGLDTQRLAQVDNDARNALYSDFVSGLRDSMGLRINQQVLDQVLGLNTGQ